MSQHNHKPLRTRTPKHTLYPDITSNQSNHYPLNQTFSIPSPKQWLTFFDSALLVIGVVALALSVLFFIAYNWLTMGYMAKFALVESILIVSILIYTFLVLKRQYPLVQRLLLLFASLITGGLLALFGQVYQTGADPWQLFFTWALLIIPWAILAQMPALWLLFLGLINIAVLQYQPLLPWQSPDFGFGSVIEISTLAGINIIAFIGWILYFKQPTLDTPKLSADEPKSPNSTTAPTQQSLHWSSYLVAILSTWYVSKLAVIGVINETNFAISAMGFLIWLAWAMGIYLYFRRRHVDLFMLTCLCGSIVTVLMIWTADNIFQHAGLARDSVLFLLLVILSSASMAWLRQVAQSLAETSDRGAV
ncbi:DUF2157 domain-containing protein [Psychrobacter sp. I-STPA6b]|uniref:DUF2157 domain-containing protein n=1 Tax=Psychrobacter sp. I-STPA6b TaxID=2585718 RepID=UPI001D0C4B97|nr:DUF2157 domain-containing protein [Psychrobacter sp. I-STPA6b]